MSKWKSGSALGALILVASTSASAQGPAASNRQVTTVDATVAEFVIGPEDVITIIFWRDKEMSGDVTVRSDGMITLPLIGEIRAAGQTPTALSREIEKLAAKYLTEPVVNVVVRQINSRQVFITGEVKAPGTYPLAGPRTVIQLIALAGGLLEFAKTDEIRVLRQEGNQSRTYRFNYGRRIAGGGPGTEHRIKTG